MEEQQEQNENGTGQRFYTTATKEQKQGQDNVFL
jgi:hypothetical protein